MVNHDDPILQFFAQISLDKKMAKSDRNHEQIFQFWSRFEAVTNWRSAIRSALASASWLKYAEVTDLFFFSASYFARTHLLDVC